MHGNKAEDRHRYLQEPYLYAKGIAGQAAGHLTVLFQVVHVFYCLLLNGTVKTTLASSSRFSFSHSFWANRDSGEVLAVLVHQGLGSFML